MNGDNYRRAVRAFQQANNLPATGILDAATWTALTSSALEPVLKPYTITDPDLAGPFDKLTTAYGPQRPSRDLTMDQFMELEDQPERFEKGLNSAQ